MIYPRSKFSFPSRADHEIITLFPSSLAPLRLSACDDVPARSLHHPDVRDEIFRLPEAGGRDSFMLFVMKGDPLA